MEHITLGKLQLPIGAGQGYESLQLVAANFGTQMLPYEVLFEENDRLEIDTVKTKDLANFVGKVQRKTAYTADYACLDATELSLRTACFYLMRKLYGLGALSPRMIVAYQLVGQGYTFAEINKRFGGGNARSNLYSVTGKSWQHLVIHYCKRIKASADEVAMAKTALSALSEQLLQVVAVLTHFWETHPTNPGGSTGDGVIHRSIAAELGLKDTVASRQLLLSARTALQGVETGRMLRWYCLAYMPPPA